MPRLEDHDAIDAILKELRTVGWKERDAVKDKLQAAAAAVTDRAAALEYLQGTLKGLPLELRWEVEEVIEALTPEPDVPDEPEPEPEPEPDDGQLRMSDLDVVYDDPRGLMVYKHKTKDAWFAVQPDPRTGQPQMFQLQPAEVTQLKSQLKGSPYWVLGAGG